MTSAGTKPIPSPLPPGEGGPKGRVRVAALREKRQHTTRQSDAPSEAPRPSPAASRLPSPGGRGDGVLCFSVILALVLACSPIQAQDLAVRVRARSETVLTGQGVDIFVDVPAADKRPRLELPKIEGARSWVVKETFKPTGMSAIGGATASGNVFSTRLRLVPTAPGRLVVPPIVATVDGRSGSSASLRLTVENPPIAGRPPGFLGGIGPFAAVAEVEPGRARVGQEVVYRIRLDGPAVWGTATRPSLDRLRRLPIDPRVVERPDETVDEPPARTFVYRIRPMKPGEVVLPPVVVAAYDPAAGRYVSRATNGVPLQVVAAPTFDPGELDYRPPPPGASRARILAALAAAAAFAAAVGLPLARRRLARWARARFPGRRRAARAWAREAAWKLAARDGTDEATARTVLDALLEYARLAADRPPGALTPEEARAAVAKGSGSDELGRRAAETVERCDRVLFAARGTGGDADERDRLERDARELFAALGRCGGRRGRRVSGRNE